MEFRPHNQDNKTKAIVLSCGVHGNETAPIEIINDIIRDLLNKTLSLKHNLLFILGNPQSMIKKKRFLDENLNRLFDGAWKNKANNIEVSRAELIEKSIESFYCKERNNRHHYDLHTAIKDSMHEKFAINPFLHGQKYNKDEFLFLKSCGVTNILLSNMATTTFSYYTSKNFNADGFTVELGKVNDFGKNKREDFIKADDCLRALISTTDLINEKYNSEDFNIYEVVGTIIKDSQSFKFLVDDTKNFIPFSKGTVISTDKDNSYIVGHEEERIVFPNSNVAIGQRAALMVAKTKLK
jgi:succinylglutamate desuccinylase